MRSIVPHHPHCPVCGKSLRLHVAKGIPTHPIPLTSRIPMLKTRRLTQPQQGYRLCTPCCNLHRDPHLWTAERYPSIQRPYATARPVHLPPPLYDPNARRPRGRPPPPTRRDTRSTIASRSTASSDTSPPHSPLLAPSPDSEIPSSSITADDALGWFRQHMEPGPAVLELLSGAVSGYVELAARACHACAQAEVKATGRAKNYHNGEHTPH